MKTRTIFGDLCLLVALLSWPAGCRVAPEEEEVTSLREEYKTQEIYRYRNRRGRLVYVNGLARVPARHRRQAAAVDLSHVSLNMQLSDDLEHAVDEQLSQLRASDYCQTTRGLASRSWWATAWRRHGHLIAIGGLLLLFLLASPYLARALGTARWVRMLIVLLPVCAFLGISTTVALKTGRTLRALREAADPCTGADSSEAAATPGTRTKRIYLLQRLKEQVEASHRSRREQLDRAVEGRDG